MAPRMEESNMKLFGALMLLTKITRRVLPIAIALACVVLFLSSSSTVLAQAPQPASTPASQPQEPEAGVEDNPTRAVFFSVREEYRNLIDGGWNNRLVLRRDAVALKGKLGGGRTGYLLRTDVPITTTHLGSETHTGLALRPRRI